MITGLNCAFCKHLHTATPEEPLTCDAFPDGIPEPIATTKVEHVEPYPGDNGIRFEPLPEHASFFDNVIDLSTMPREEAVQWLMKNFRYDRDEAEKEVAIERGEIKHGQEVVIDGRKAKVY